MERASGFDPEETASPNLKPPKRRRMKRIATRELGLRAEAERRRKMCARLLIEEKSLWGGHGWRKAQHGAAHTAMLKVAAP